MSFFKINDTIINTVHVIRVTQECTLGSVQPDTVTLWYIGGGIQVFEYQDAEVVWDYFSRNTVDLNEAIEMAARLQGKAAGEDIPW